MKILFDKINKKEGVFLKLKSIIGFILTIILVIPNLHTYAFSKEKDQLKSAELLIQEKFNKTEAEAHEAVQIMQNHKMTNEEILNWAETMQEGTTEQYEEAAREKLQKQQLSEIKDSDIRLRTNPFSLGKVPLVNGYKGNIIIDTRQGGNRFSNSYWSAGHRAFISKNTVNTIDSFALDWSPFIVFN